MGEWATEHLPLAPSPPRDDAPYNPLSPGDDDEDEPEPTAEELTRDDREEYAKFPGRFTGDFDQRLRYYHSQVTRYCGTDPEADPREHSAAMVGWMQEMDLHAARADQEAQATLAECAVPLTDEQVAELRREMLVAAIMVKDRIIPSDAEELIAEGHYDPRAGRMGWDIEFEQRGECGGGDRGEFPMTKPE